MTKIFLFGGFLIDSQIKLVKLKLISNDSLFKHLKDIDVFPQTFYSPIPQLFVNVKEKYSPRQGLHDILPGSIKW